MLKNNYKLLILKVNEMFTDERYTALGMKLLLLGMINKLACRIASWTVHRHAIVEQQFIARQLANRDSI